MTQGKEYAELEWPIDIAITLVWVVFGITTKRELAAHALASGAEGARKEGDPAFALEQSRIVCEQLLRDLPSMGSEKQRLDAIVERLGEIQKTHLAAFVDARPRLVAKLGLGGYAELMDRFAAAERQLNRAWSAAADGYFDEAHR